MLAFTLILFDRSAPAYLWIGFLFLATALRYGIPSIGLLAELLGTTSYVLIREIDAALVFALWVIVWWTRFGRAGFGWLLRYRQ